MTARTREIRRRRDERGLADGLIVISSIGSLRMLGARPESADAGAGGDRFSGYRSSSPGHVRPGLGSQRFGRRRGRDIRVEIGDVIVGPGPAERLIDESPRAYRDVRAVMRAQRELVRIERTLRAKICYKGAGR